MRIFKNISPLFVIGLVFWTNVAKSDGYYSYREILNVCQKSDLIYQARCNGYIAGVADFVQMMSDQGVLNGKACFRSATIGDIKKVVVDFLRTQAFDADTSAASLVLKAILIK